MIMVFSPLWRRPKYLFLISGIFMFGFGLKGAIEGISNPFPKTITIEQFETQRPSSGWYHVTGGQFDLSQAVLLDKSGGKPGYGDPAAMIEAPLWSANEAQGSMPRVFVRSSDPAMLAAEAAGASLKPMDVSGMIETNPNTSDAATVVLDDGKKPGSILIALLLLVFGLAATGLAICMIAGLQVPFLDGPSYEWSADTYVEKGVKKGPPAAAYPQQSPQQGGYPGSSGYPSAQSPYVQPQESTKMKTIE